MQLRDPMNSGLTRWRLTINKRRGGKKHIRFIQSKENERAGLRGTGQPNPSRKTRFSRANGDRSKNIYIPVQLTTSRVGATLPYPVDPHSCYLQVNIHTYIHTCTGDTLLVLSRNGSLSYHERCLSQSFLSRRSLVQPRSACAWCFRLSSTLDNIQ